MTINELCIQLDLQPENRIDILENAAFKCDNGYLFVDSSDGHCHLFDTDGNEDKIKKLKKIDDTTFYECKSLMSIIIPDSVENIGDYAFYCCENLKSIEIPDSVKNIGFGAFSHCKSLTLIVIPNSVESIEKFAFWNCKSLKSLSFKGKTLKQVKEMKSYPFGIEDESIIRCV